MNGRHGTRRILAAPIVVAIACAAAATVGLLFPDVYQEPDSAAGVFSKAYWRGNDLVTLFVMAPVLMRAQYRAARGSWRARLVTLGALYYACYNASFYVFGGELNWFFPCHLGIVVLSGAALLRAVVTREVPAVAFPADRRRTEIWVGGYMALVGVIVMVLWCVQWASRVAAGDSGTVKGEFTRTVAAIDIPALAVAFLLTAGWLLRRGPWGRPAACVLNTGIAGYMLVLTAAALTNAGEGVAGAVAESGIWVVLGAGCLAAAVATARGPARESAPDQAGEQAPAPAG